MPERIHGQWCFAVAAVLLWFGSLKLAASCSPLSLAVLALTWMALSMLAALYVLALTWQ